MKLAIYDNLYNRSSIVFQNKKQFPWTMNMHVLQSKRSRSNQYSHLLKLITSQHNRHQLILS